MIYFLNVIFYLQENIMKNMNFEVCNVFASHGFEIAENKIYDFCSDFLNNLEEVTKKKTRKFFLIISSSNYKKTQLFKRLIFIFRAIIMLCK